MRVARRYVITGRVQGVGFRYFTQDAALREGFTGWVRNLPDGRVEALVEGEAEAVTRVERGVVGRRRLVVLRCERQQCIAARHQATSYTWIAPRWLSTLCIGICS